VHRRRSKAHVGAKEFEWVAPLPGIVDRGAGCRQSPLAGGLPKSLIGHEQTLANDGFQASIKVTFDN
jgi:hypothetical protein